MIVVEVSKFDQGTRPRFLFSLNIPMDAFPSWPQWNPLGKISFVRYGYSACNHYVAGNLTNIKLCKALVFQVWLGEEEVVLLPRGLHNDRSDIDVDL